MDRRPRQDWAWVLLLQAKPLGALNMVLLSPGDWGWWMSVRGSRPRGCPCETWTSYSCVLGVRGRHQRGGGYPNRVKNCLLKLRGTSHRKTAFQGHPLWNACKDLGVIKMGAPEALDVFYWGLYKSLASLSIRLMDDVVNMLILKKHNFLNVLPPLVSSNLGENLGSS